MHLSVVIELYIQLRNDTNWCVRKDTAGRALYTLARRPCHTSRLSAILIFIANVLMYHSITSTAH